jgi:hypothetical protein
VATTDRFASLLADLLPPQAPSGDEGPLRAILTAHLEAMGAEVEVDPVGNLSARRGEGGSVVVLALDEPTFAATGAGPDGRGVAALGTALPSQELDGHVVRSRQGGKAVLRAGERGLLLDPLVGTLEPGTVFTYAAQRRVAGAHLVGPGIGTRALQAAALAALAELPEFTLVALARTGIAGRGGQELLFRLRRPVGVALDAVLEEDGSEMGAGPLEFARAAGYARPASLAGLSGVRCLVRAQESVLASLLLPAGILSRSLALAVRYRGGDQERLHIQDAVRLVELLQSALSPS